MAGSVGVYTVGAMPFVASLANTNWATRTNSSTELAMGRLVTDTTAQNNAVSWPLYLDSVTWKCALVHGKGTDQGIFTVNLDGSSQGTIDAYNGAATSNNYSEITGLTVTTAGVKTFQLIMATKNASSSAYGAALNSWLWCRTGGSASTPAGTDTPGYTWEWIPWMGYKAATGITLRTQWSIILGGGYTEQSGVGAQNDLINTDIWVDSGTCTLNAMWGYTGSNRGIATWTLGAQTLGTTDGYSAPDAQNRLLTITGIVPSTTGILNLQAQAATKNASSTGWLVSLASVKWTRTGA